MRCAKGLVRGVTRCVWFCLFALSGRAGAEGDSVAAALEGRGDFVSVLQADLSGELTGVAPYSTRRIGSVEIVGFGGVVSLGGVPHVSRSARLTVTARVAGRDGCGVLFDKALRRMIEGFGVPQSNLVDMEGVATWRASWEGVYLMCFEGQKSEGGLRDVTLSAVRYFGGGDAFRSAKERTWQEAYFGVTDGSDEKDSL